MFFFRAGDVQGKPRKGERTQAGVLITGTFIFMRWLNMDVQVVGQLVASLGFPIVACGAMFWLVNKNEERHKEEIDGMRKTIEDNTTVLTSLKELIQLIINKEK